jgi:hypothetical protein
MKVNESWRHNAANDGSLSQIAEGYIQHHRTPGRQEELLVPAVATFVATRSSQFWSMKRATPAPFKGLSSRASPITLREMFAPELKANDRWGARRL